MIERDKEFYNHKISELYAVIENQEKIIRDLQERNSKSIEEINYYDTIANHIDDNVYWDEKLANNLLEILKGDNNG